MYDACAILLKHAYDIRTGFLKHACCICMFLKHACFTHKTRTVTCMYMKPVCNRIITCHYHACFSKHACLYMTTCMLHAHFSSRADIFPIKFENAYSRSPKYEVSYFLPEVNISYHKSALFCSSHLEYFYLPKGKNSTPTWMLLHISQREIISKEKNFIERSQVTTSAAGLKREFAVRSSSCEI